MAVLYLSIFLIVALITQARCFIHTKRLVSRQLNQLNLVIHDETTSHGDSDTGSYSAINRNKALPMVAAISGLLLFPSSSHAAIATTESMNIIESILNHWQYFVCGSLCCTISHGVTVPIDVIKTRIQVTNVEGNKENNILSVTKDIINDEGIAVLFSGMGSTLLGYAVHGWFKYGFYESFKPLVKAYLETSWLSSTELSLFTFILSGALAEVFAAGMLTPFEAARIRSVSNPVLANNGVITTLSKMYNNEGLSALFQGYPPLLFKHIPYTVTQLTCYEVLTKYIYSNFAGISQVNSVVVSTAVAIIAAILSSIASQPGDTLLSIVNKQARTTSSKETVNPINLMVNAVSDLGFLGLFKGLKARLIHVSVIVVVQLVVYDNLKMAFGLATGH